MKYKTYEEMFGKERAIERKINYSNIKLIGIGTGDDIIYDTHIPWEDREKLLCVLKNS
jgi:hypothetical protein